MRAVLACTKASIHTLHDKESPSEQFAYCEGNPQVTQGFPTQRVNGGVFDAFVALIWTSCWIQSRLTGDLQTIMLLWWKTGVKPVESVKKLFVKRRLNGAPLPLVFIMHLGFGRLYTYLCPQILPQNWWLVTYLFNNQSSWWWFEIPWSSCDDTLMGCTLGIVLNEHISTHFTQQIFITFTKLNIFSHYSPHEVWKSASNINGAPILTRITITCIWKWWEGDMILYCRLMQYFW